MSDDRDGDDPVGEFDGGLDGVGGLDGDAFDDVEPDDEIADDDFDDDLLDELVRTWAEKGARSHEAAEHVCEAIRDAFPEGHVQRHEYEHFALGSSGLHDHSRVHALGEEQAGGRVAAVIEPVALHASQHIAISAVLEGGRWRA